MKSFGKSPSTPTSVAAVGRRLRGLHDPRRFRDAVRRDEGCRALKVFICEETTPPAGCRFVKPEALDAIAAPAEAMEFTRSSAMFDPRPDDGAARQSAADGHPVRRGMEARRGRTSDEHDARSRLGSEFPSLRARTRWSCGTANRG